MAWTLAGNIKGPKGDTGAQGPAGTGINMKGQVPSEADLPTDAAVGDAYTTADTMDLYVWVADDGSGSPGWVNQGPMQGPQGEQGPQGDAGPAGEQGPQGDAGPTGDPGADGADGISMTSGSGAPDDTANPGVTAGDSYVDTATGDVYTWNGTTWTASGDSLMGPTGAKGDTGDAGATGAKGDPGADGADGTMWLVGDGAPDGTVTGNPGDLYLDTSTGDVYQLAA